MKQGKLILEDGSVFEGYSFGYENDVSGEVVFNTGMVGYPESFTDPSYKGQILVLAYPLIGNYGIPDEENENNIKKKFESDKIQITALIVQEYSKNAFHHLKDKNLSSWLTENKIPALYNIDTRELIKRLRERGVMLGKIIFNNDMEFYDPNKDNLVEQVSVKEIVEYGNSDKKIILLDCGVKNNIIRNLIKRNLRVIRVPYDYDFTKLEYDGLVISNGPGNPKLCHNTIENIKKALEIEKPIFGICLGNQLLALAINSNTYKMKYGHRSQNQPCLMLDENRCFVTSQNHGYAVDEKTLPENWKTYFTNLNDNTNEGIRHKTKPFFAVQFHPEANPGPIDTEFLFDEFVKLLR